MSTGAYLRCPLLYFTLAAQFAQAVTLTLAPVTDCAGGFGRATLRWEAESPVELRVHDAKGPAMTGLEPAIGQATTGYWVTDGMLFVLVDATGKELARAVANLQCGGSPAIRAALTQGSFFPLDIGNQWVYRVNNRQITSTYDTWRVTRFETFETQRYSVVTTSVGERWFREDDAGRIWESQNFPAGRRESLWLDPSTATRRAGLATPLGTWPEALEYRFQEPLSVDDRVFARGLGLVSSNSRLLTGSSGGFTGGLELVSAQVSGALRFASPVPSLALGVEATDLDVTGRKVTNCVVPCYFVACGFGSPVDPPGTYRPCFQVRVELGAAGPIEVEFANEAGEVLAKQTGRGNLAFFQLPLYTKPNEPFAPGRYRVTARQGVEQTAVINIRLR